MNNASIRILALDDDTFILKVLAHMLTKLGFVSVTTCDTGQAALEWVDAGSTSSDLILTDLNMPQMDGVEFVRKLVEHDFCGSLILVSGEDERILHMVQKLINAHRITLLGCLSKPVSMGALSALMEKFLRSRHGAQTVVKPYTVAALRAAISGGELTNFYQPKVAVATGAVVGVETLVRWRHPHDGLLGPEHFIGLAEEHGLIDELTQVVLLQAMDQCRAWKDAGLHLRVSVNISANNLAWVRFADFVAEAVATTGALPQDIILEVTESRLMGDQRTALDVLARLQLKRFSLSIDDFGTGHSSLAQLRDIAFEELKIDQSFVRDAWYDGTSRAIYDASLSLGKQLGMTVVAEGVEELDEWNLVRRTQCDIAQGFFIARPMQPDELPGWLLSWQERLPELLVPVK